MKPVSFEIDERYRNLAVLIPKWVPDIMQRAIDMEFTLPSVMEAVELQINMINEALGTIDRLVT